MKDHDQKWFPCFNDYDERDEIDDLQDEEQAQSKLLKHVERDIKEMVLVNTKLQT
jgi:hypothetical protein